MGEEVPEDADRIEHRPGDSMRIGPPPRWTRVTMHDLAELFPITDLLMAGAWADGKLDLRERDKVRHLLARLMGVSEAKLPLELEGRIAGFEPDAFDLATTVRSFHEMTPRERRRLVAMVREVCDADQVLDIEEDRFVVALVLSLALREEDVDGLLFKVVPGLNGWWKRAFDVVFATTFLLMFWPLLLLLALCVRLSSPGPALFRQRRYGRDGEEIEVFKFRTMRVQEDGLEVRQAKKGDPRVTRLGALMRRTSLDELPQFVNVLTGSMSVVGPRPHAVAHNQHYRMLILEYMLRHRAKPGITGWAQVNGWRGETETLDKMAGRVEHDLEYMRRWSFWLDLKIIWLTVFGRKVRQGAY